MVIDPRRLGELVPGLDRNNIYDNVSIVDDAVLQRKATEDLVV
jgi:hypothetical protein